MRIRRIVATLALAFAVLASGAVEPQPAPPPTRVDITTQPAGATLSVDGAARGKTPASLQELPAGRHRFTCRLDGYAPYDEYALVAAGEPLERTITLEPLRGILLLRSEPAGAAVEADGVALGQTPRLVTTLTALDEHEITLSKPGFVTAKFKVKFDGRRPLVRTERLQADSGTLEILSEPAGADVIVNGVARGKTPLVVKEVPKGTATVKVTCGGFSPETREVVVAAGQSQKLALPLKALPGVLSVASVPEGARIYLNGTFKGKTPLVIRDLAPGDYGLRAEHDDCATATREIRIENGAHPTEEFRLESMLGRLEVRTAPAGAEVFLDGKSVGKTPESGGSDGFSGVLPVERVRAGEHSVVLRCAGYADQQFKREVKTGKTATVRRTLKPVLVPDVVVVTMSGERVKGRKVSETPNCVTIEYKLGIERTFMRQDVKLVLPIELAK